MHPQWTLWMIWLLALTTRASNPGSQEAEAVIDIEKRAHPFEHSYTSTQTIQVTAIMSPLASGMTTMLVSPSPTTINDPSADSSPLSAAGAPTSTTSPAEISQISTVAAKTSSRSHENLVIILSSIFGVLGLVLIVLGTWLCIQRRRRAGFWSKRSATPIDDDEIASWRGTMIDRRSSEKLTIDTSVRGLSTASLAGSPPWTWDLPGLTSTTAFHYPSDYPTTPPLIAQAPNARAGLTDEIVPGEDPFIMPPRRQSTRLSKPHPGHNRTKSRRSSTSGVSIWSSRSRPRESNDLEPTWYDPEDGLIGRELPSTPRLSSSRGDIDREQVAERVDSETVADEILRYDH